MANATTSRVVPRRITGDVVRLVLGRLRGLTAIAVMSIIGIGISIYLTSVHYAKVPLFCSTSGVIDCASVLKSPYGVVPGTQLPITFPGIVWFVVSGGIAVWVLLAAMRGMPPSTWWSNALKGWGIIGLFSILYLIYAEIVKLHHICAWCTVIHALVVVTLLVALMQDTTMPTLPAQSGAIKSTAPSVKSASNAAAQRPNATGKSITSSRPSQSNSRVASRPMATTKGGRPSSATAKAKTPMSAGAKNTR